jgi:hypothetical protein
MIEFVKKTTTPLGRVLARIIPVPIQDHTPDCLIAFLRRWRIAHPAPDFEAIRHELFGNSFPSFLIDQPLSPNPIPSAYS